jgi:hypothetical protein
MSSTRTGWNVCADVQRNRVRSTPSAEPRQHLVVEMQSAVVRDRTRSRA